MLTPEVSGPTPVFSFLWSYVDWAWGQGFLGVAGLWTCSWEHFLPLAPILASSEDQLLWEKRFPHHICWGWCCLLGTNVA